MIIMLLFTMLMAVVGMTAAIVDFSGRLFYKVARVWSRNVMKLGGLKVKINNGAALDLSQSYVICSNHQSQLDIPVLIGHLPVSVRFLAKRSLFYIPIFGWSLYIAKYVPIDRGSGAKAKRSIEICSQMIKTGPSLAVFPEGTRSPDGKTHEFKSGAFIMAIKAKVPVLPVAIKGTYKLMPKSTVGIKKGDCELIIGEPISTFGMKVSDARSLSRKVKSQVSLMLKT